MTISSKFNKWSKAFMLSTAFFLGFAGAASAQIADAASGTFSSGATSDPQFIPHGVSPWTSMKEYDSGYEASVAMTRTDLLVEVHTSSVSHPFYMGLYYRIGKLNRALKTVEWGESNLFLQASNYARLPSVAITREGYVIISVSNSFSKANASLGYFVGTINPAGSIDQKIDFKIQNERYDTGFRSSVAVNYDDKIVEAHEGNGSDNLFYRVGHFRAPHDGDFTIVWDSGSGGIKYDIGSAPKISVNDLGDVVEVHTTTTDPVKSHYARGKLSGSTITFSGPHPRLDDHGYNPAVVVLNDGYVMELHIHITSGGIFGDDTYDLRYRLGKLSADKPNWIDWISEDKIYRNKGISDIASNGEYAVATSGEAQWLNYMVAIAP